MRELNFKYLKWVQPPILIFLCLLFLIGCTAEQQVDEDAIVQEITKTDKNMYYKFYKSKSAGLLQKEQMVEFINAFDKIYAENDVDVVGTWYNIDDPSETYFITAFKSEQHYTDFIEKMKTHVDYQRMSTEMEPDRLSIEAATLKSYNEN
jgi:hypothetical protein